MIGEFLALDGFVTVNTLAGDSAIEKPDYTIWMSRDHAT